MVPDQNSMHTFLFLPRALSYLILKDYQQTLLISRGAICLPVFRLFRLSSVHPLRRSRVIQLYETSAVDALTLIGYEELNPNALYERQIYC